MFVMVRERQKRVERCSESISLSGIVLRRYLPRSNPVQQKATIGILFLQTLGRPCPCSAAAKESQRLVDNNAGKNTARMPCWWNERLSRQC